MDTKITKAQELMEENLFETNLFDRTNYDKNMQSVKFLRVKLNYSLEPLVNVKLVKDHNHIKVKKLRHIPKKSKEINTQPGFKGYYKFKDNRIVYIKDIANVETLIHEMVHLSSRKSPRKFGFAKTNKNGQLVLNHLNEGFTHWTTKIALNKDDYDNDIYVLQTRIAKLIHLAVGDEVIEMFSNGDFKKLQGFYANKKSNSPIKKIAYLLEELKYIDFYASSYAYEYEVNRNFPFDHARKVITKLMRFQEVIINQMQRYIIDLYFQNENNLNDDEKLLYFGSSLISDGVDNDYLYEKLTMYGNKIGDDAIRYFNNKVKRVYDAEGNVKIKK